MGWGLSGDGLHHPGLLSGLFVYNALFPSGEEAGNLRDVTSQLLPRASLPCAAFSASLPIRTQAGSVPVVSMVGQDREGHFGFGFIESEVSNE